MTGDVEHHEKKGGQQRQPVIGPAPENEEADHTPARCNHRVEDRDQHGIPGERKATGSERLKSLYSEILKFLVCIFARRPA